MPDDPNNPETLLSVPTEVEAAVIVNALAERGIHAFALGGNTAGFAWESPGLVNVVVKRADAAQARKALAEIEAERRTENLSTDDT
jgi:hypothetical protein